MSIPDNWQKILPVADTTQFLSPLATLSISNSITIFPIIMPNIIARADDGVTTISFTSFQFLLVYCILYSIGKDLF